MPCFKPLEAWRSHIPGKSGKYGIVFSPVFGQKSINVPCGQCIGCRLERSRQWAMRCMHEASLYEDNCFITLTYSDDCLPPDGGLHVDHFQKFMKRLRKFVRGDKFLRLYPSYRGCKIRFFHCGEYGDRFGRPHYHAIIFGFDFPDKVKWRSNDRGDQIWRSPILESLWTCGLSEIGSVTFESAAYVARYIVKKVTGDMAEAHYHRVDGDSGEYYVVKPEYVTMSRRPGIGKDWFDKFRSEVYPSDTVVLRGMEMKPPKYYDRMYELDNPIGLYELKKLRVVKALKHVDNNTAERLEVREKVTRARLTQLKREVD